jgi:hypothetical protein
MSFKDKIMNIEVSLPKLVIFGMGLGITFVIETAIGIVDHNQLVFARTFSMGTR